MKKVDVVLGLQWGDEGKGKVVDVLTPNYDVIARFQGGPNAGHSLHFGGEKFVLHTVPSGIFRDGSMNIIGNGVVIDPVILAEEISQIEATGIDVVSRMKISKRAHLILPTHRALDAASEAAKGKTKIGSTLKGIGPAYMDKTGRNGLRVGDILLPDFMERYQALKDKHLFQLRQYDYQVDTTAYEQEWFRGIEALKRFEFVDSEMVVNNYLKQDTAILAEGAQGSLLDIDFGTYPYVTSSNTLCAGVCTGLGVAPTRIGEVYGIFKAYCTRVGEGPFPTELHDELAHYIRERGHEYGTVTGRPRRVGWLDVVALRHAARVSGVNYLSLMLFDVLSGLEKVCICTAYELDGQVIDYVPSTIAELERCKPVLEELPGWEEDTTTCRSVEEMPEAAQRYIARIEELTGAEVAVVSVGPDREQTILRKDFF